VAIEFSCACGLKLQVADELAGKPVRCPSCHEVRQSLVSSASQPPGDTPSQDLPAAKTRLVRRSIVPPHVLNARSSRWALAAFATPFISGFVGLFTLLLTLAWIPGGALGIVFGVVALFRIRASNGALRGKGRAWLGIVAGALLLSFSILLRVIASDFEYVLGEVCKGCQGSGRYDCGN
jgi:hypothetical protein